MSDNFNGRHEDLQQDEIVSFIKKKMSRKQVLNIAIIVCIFSVIFAVSMILSSFDKLFWMEAAYNFVCASFVVSGLWVMVKLIYRLVNNQTSFMYPEIMTEKEIEEIQPPKVVTKRKTSTKK